MMPLMPASTILRKHSRILRSAVLAMAMIAATPVVGRADEEAVPDHDARLDGYPTSIVLNSGGTASSYIMLFLLSVVGLGCVFISGKRSHLD